jgi:hypothetical protein
MPQRRLAPTCRDGRMVADLFGNITIFLVESQVLKGLALDARNEKAREAYEEQENSQALG